MNKIYKKLFNKLKSAYDENEYSSRTGYFLKRAEMLKEENRLTLMQKCNLQTSSLLDGVKSNYFLKVVYEYFNLNKVEGIIDLVNMFKLLVKYNKKYGEGDIELFGDKIFNPWCLAVFFELDEMRENLQSQLKYCVENDLAEADEEDRIWHSETRSCVFPIVQNMLASQEKGEFSLVEKEPDYGQFFDLNEIDKDAILKQQELHLERTKPLKLKGMYEPFDDPCLILVNAIMPMQMLAWYRMAKNQNIELETKGTIIEPFLNIEYRKGIRDPDLLKIVEVLSETVGEDVLKLIE